ncbi:MAG: mannose-1-phosphate guanylyltransferase/mannose-6-phosphate isomerase [Alphaproteobacteria bacterium]|nr:mannose-1-phosphate guanylyltransferase/mannose-6-phosphate isomerase [Alphaproteobacteria bacterium]
MKSASGLIYPFILSGGSGTRLWPLSRSTFPKQFQPLAGDRSLLQQSCERVAAPGFAAPSVLCNNDHRFLVADQVSQVGLLEGATIILEPVARNTAPAALVAALAALTRDAEALVLLMPSDHVIADADGFRSSVARGVPAARNGDIVTFGVKPDKPETGYGYIEVGPLAESGAQTVSRFVEKPQRDVAEAYLKAGNYLWNAGIFLYAARTMVAAFAEHAPDTLEAAREAFEKAQADLDFLRLDKAAYARCENQSLDYAIIEKTGSVACVPLASDWSDLGSWQALWEIGGKDADGNVKHGDVVLHDTHDSYVQAPDGLCLALVGMRDVIAVATNDAVLVAPKDRAQDVKHIVEQLKRAGRAEADQHTRVYRPWGWYEQRGQGNRFQVKYLMVKPGAKLSLQSHHHRAEHWIVVSGTAEVTVDDRTFLLTENESTYIPLGSRHRLGNPGRVPALLVEVQSGAYLGEDDIVRYEDDFNRQGEDVSLKS